MNSTQLYLTILLAGFVPTYAWRLAAVLLVSRIDPNSRILLWVRSVATALVAALVTRLVLAPPGLLGETTLATRLIALSVAVCCFYLVRSNRAAIAVAAASTVVFVAQLRFG